MHEFEFSQHELKISRSVHSVLENFHSWRETNHAVKDQWKLSRLENSVMQKIDQCKLLLREIKSENFHAVKLIGRDKKLHALKSNLSSFVFLSTAATLNKSNIRIICKRISTIVES